MAAWMVFLTFDGTFLLVDISLTVLSVDENAIFPYLCRMRKQML